MDPGWIDSRLERTSPLGKGLRAGRVPCPRARLIEQPDGPFTRFQPGLRGPKA
jgi:hypothetical protein